MDYDLQDIKFHPRRVKILWNWNIPVGSLVSVLPNTSLQRKSDITASVEGRCFFASPRSAVELSSLVETVEKTLIEEISNLFLCGFIDYELSFRVETKLALDDIEGIIKMTDKNPGFLQQVIEGRLGLLLKALGFNPPIHSRDNQV
jgi:hypothetical protein